MDLKLCKLLNFIACFSFGRLLWSPLKISEIIMCIVPSLLFGSEGHCKVLGFQVRFTQEGPAQNFFTHNFNENCFVRALKTGAGLCLKTRVFHVLTLSYMHMFVHEFGHALALKILGRYKGRVDVNIQTTPILFGKMSVEEGHFVDGKVEVNKSLTPITDHKFSPAILTLIHLAGPVADMIFTSALFVAAAVLYGTAMQPVAYGVAAGAALWAAGEMIFALSSASQRTCDFGYIRNHGCSHLLFSTIALVGTCAAGVFGAYRYLKANHLIP